jgi:hypothetical protein
MVLIIKDCATEMQSENTLNYYALQRRPNRQCKSNYLSDSNQIPYYSAIYKYGEELTRDRITICIPCMATPETSSYILCIYDITALLFSNISFNVFS